tara:strand:- start:121 stop:354 length:234 start_codon:yes stop_codon:yes gene_type:complete
MKNKLLILLAILTIGCETYNSPNGAMFPWGWGAPPEIQTKDYVVLPAGYGHGSSTLKNWIELNMERDRINKELNKYD